MISVIIPASNEAHYLGTCLDALFGSVDEDGKPIGGQVIVVANGCRDHTAEIARGYMKDKKAWDLHVIELQEGSKPLALNAGDQAARFGLRAYLDADVVVSARLLHQIVKVLSQDDGAIFASGTPHIPPPRSWTSRAYARFWQGLPFNRAIAAAYGFFAVNPAGRARWGAFPNLISDDTFVRLQFLPEERRQVPARYDWPMIEGFAALRRVRRRQNLGVAQICTTYPHLMAREGKATLSKTALLRQALQDPLGFAAYAAVAVAVKFGPSHSGFTRGR